MSIAFDASYYLLAYPDVAAAVVRGQFPNAYSHFVLHGAKELRNPNAQFNAAEYTGLYPDVANAVAAGNITSVWDHYVNHGISENRAPSLALKDFDAASYLAIHTDVAAAVTAGAFKSAIDHYLLNGQAEGRTWGEDVSLTNGTDKLIANKFVAGLVYTPGGNDRINSLQDEDELTGIGDNPTLTATLGNANDNGGTVITPILKNIETVNVAFTGSGGVGGVAAVEILDLQDSTGLTKAVNITRITDGQDAYIRNLTSVPAELSVANSNSPSGNIHFTFVASATAGTADVTRLTLSNVQTGTVKVGENSNVNGVETINLVSNGRGPNVVGIFDAKDLVTLNITGAQNLTIGTINDRNIGKLTTIDGSTATGNLNLTIDADLNNDIRATTGTGKAIDFTLKTGSGNDTLNVTAAGLIGNAADTINLGSGDDTVIFNGGGGAITWTDEKTSAAFAGVEAINVIRTTGNGVDPTTLTLDLSRITADEGKSQTITLTNRGDSPALAPFEGTATFILQNASAEQAAAIRLTHSSNTNNALADTVVQVGLKTATGATDTVALTIVDGLNSEPRFNFELTAGGVTDATRVENVTLIDSDTESNTVKLTHGDAALGHTGTITLKGGQAGQFLNLDWSEKAQRRDDSGLASDGVGIANTEGSNTGALVAAVINAEDYAGDVTVRVSSTPAAISATGAQTIKMGSGNDFVIFDNLNGDTRAGLSVADTVSGGAGSDTLGIGGGVAIDLGASEWTNVTGFETIRLLGNGVATGPGAPAGTYGYILDLTDALVTRNAADGKVINIVNDNDPANDTAGAAVTGGVGVVSAALIDARALSAGLGFNYNGEEGAARTNDRFVFVDRNIDATVVIDGGADDTDATLTWVGNRDVLEVRNSAVVSSGDLQHIKNVGTIELTNDAAAVQNFTVQLNDTVVNNLVDSYHNSTAAESETLVIIAIDNPLLPTAHSILRLEAAELTARSNVVVVGSAGADTLILGGGADIITAGAGNDSLTGGAGADTFVFAATAAANGSDIITDFTVGVGGDVLNFSAFAIDGNGTATAPAAIAVVLAANPGATDIAGTIARLVDIGGGEDITTAAGLQTALAAGEYANINMAASSKAIIITSATNGADNDFVFYATSDAGGVITVSLVATLNNVDIDNYVTANFLI